MGRRSLLSGPTKDLIAQQLGVRELVDREGWGAVPARQCGMIVRIALEQAERALEERGNTVDRRRPSDRP
jgi:small acid-soluble spore protein F (minor alpha/beta-type SASP)